MVTSGSERLWHVLKNEGIVADVIDKTPELSISEIRGTEIKKWIKDHLEEVDRFAIVDDNGDATFYSRTGKEFDTLGIVADGIKALGITNVVFDGELCLVDDDGNEDFQGIMKQLKKMNF